MKNYTATEIAENLGIRIERLRDWINRGLVVPSIQKASGRGIKNLFSKYDLYRIYLFEKLLDYGINRTRAQKLSRIKFEDLDVKKYSYSVEIMRDRRTGELHEISGKLINDPSEIKFKRNDAFLFVINLAEMKGAVDKMLSS
jgi:DNA-binding transcriptional MerR regulator